ncbi:LOW QUALITY PROTEIN: hypothetical protein Ct61P_08328 [Colletotrichum tofieldiae]|nr:LOW QUALITY PROTEIN: hypothetical protein Ct61P_08328 [Colletotrichum tofieldiae]
MTNNIDGSLQSPVPGICFSLTLDVARDVGADGNVSSERLTQPITIGSFAGRHTPTSVLLGPYTNSTTNTCYGFRPSLSKHSVVASSRSQVIPEPHLGSLVVTQPHLAAAAITSPHFRSFARHPSILASTGPFFDGPSGLLPFITPNARPHPLRPELSFQAMPSNPRLTSKWTLGRFTKARSPPSDRPIQAIDNDDRDGHT